MTTVRRAGFAALLCCLVAACATELVEPVVTDATRATLAPTGSLRVGVYVGSPSSIILPVRADETTRGVGYDLGQAMARRLGVPFVPVVFDNNGLVLEAVRHGDVDVTFTNATPARAREMDFSPAFLEVEKSFLVAAGSQAHALADMQRAGLKVGVSAGSSTALELAPLFPAATIVAVPTLQRAVEMLRDGTIAAFATNKSILFELSDRLPGSRVLPGSWGLEHFAAGIPKGRESQHAFIVAFVDAARREGLVNRAVLRAGLRGSVAP